MHVRGPVLLVSLMLAAGPIRSQDAKIVDSASTRGDFRQIAERLSMHLRFELTDVNAETLAETLRLYGQLGSAAKSDDSGLAALAKETAETYSRLESLHFIYEPKEFKFGPILLGLMTKAIANGRLAEDTDKLRRFQHAAWVRLMPYAEKFAGPEREGNAALGTFIQGQIGFRNESGRDLTNCTLVVTRQDLWGRDIVQTFFLPVWKKDAGFDDGDLRSILAVRQVGYRLLADQLRDERVNCKNEVTRAAEKGCKAVMAAFAPQKARAGHWSNGRAAGEARFTIDEAADSPPFIGPTLRGTIFDVKTKTTFQFSGHIHTHTAAEGKSSWSLRVAGKSTGPKGLARSFTFRVEDSEIVGNDNQGNTFRFKLE